MNRSATSTASPALAAFGSLAVFPLIIVVLHIVQLGDYHPLRQAISELALGRAGWLMTVAFCSSGIGTMLLALALRRGSTKPRLAPTLLAAAGLFSFVSAFVHADPSTSAITTTHGQIHKLAGIATFILIIAAMFLLVRSFRRDSSWRPLATPTRVWAFAALASFFLIPVAGDAYFGLAQRLLIGTSLTWLLTTSLYAHRLGRRTNTGSGRDTTVARVETLTEIRHGSPDPSTT